MTNVYSAVATQPEPMPPIQRPIIPPIIQPLIIPPIIQPPIVPMPGPGVEPSVMGEFGIEGQQCVNGEFKKHPSDCSKFFECFNEKLREASCFPGSHWDGRVSTYYLEFGYKLLIQ